ncbi:sugar ABC transporter ATP-binding protein [Candidatus Pelagisphaera phototrophica]|uniref:sugar ABC transporter ATP-binding protein n=1 Tax=Candidatus Pelagisphaera phototrophica TaxID=2684113 RepID=UPI0024B7A908|nr:sugar ABC transporter ATP-binding protein [Candidatus Pelagisphaera phototrophica]
MPASVADSLIPVLEMKEIVKTFPGVKALKAVSLKLKKGEALGLVGENGAGKSTLIKTLGGVHLPESGEIRLGGQCVSLTTPSVSQSHGIAIIYQEFNLAPNLTSSENLFLGKEVTRHGFINHSREEDLTRELFYRLGMDIDPRAKCRDLTVAEQQTVEIARALAADAQIIVMDEPTAALSKQEVDKLLAIIEDLKREGISIIYISHRLEEVFAIADRITVLRDGESVGESATADVSKNQLIEWMVGRPMEEEFPKRKVDRGPVCLKVEGLSRGCAVQDVSFELHEGEVLGLAGLVGSGRTETARLLFGADPADSGSIFMKGAKIDLGNPRDSIERGICLLTEDRKEQGLILIHSSVENFGLPNLKEFQENVFISQGAEVDAFKGHVNSLKIRLSNPSRKVGELSGGNQQKVVIAKWLQRNADIFIFDEPTRGIDVGAKYEIYLLINQLVKGGKSVLLISSELPEVIGMSDRIIVMKEGRIQGIVNDAQRASQEEVLEIALGE